MLVPLKTRVSAETLLFTFFLHSFVPMPVKGHGTYWSIIWLQKGDGETIVKGVYETDEINRQAAMEMLEVPGGASGRDRPSSEWARG